jgi:hypothetical protein
MPCVSAASHHNGRWKSSPACFIARDHNGQASAYVYFEDEPGRRSAAKLLRKDEARRIAANKASDRQIERPPP